MVYMTSTVTTEEALADVRRREWIPTPSEPSEQEEA
jgi:hypothetical protein